METFEELICEQCNKVFRQRIRWAKRAKHHFCSRKCHDLFQTKYPPKKCEICGELFKIRGSMKKYSTCPKPECRQQKKQGQYNGRWKGGVTPLHNRDMATIKYKTWRKSVFERDNYTCQHPNCKQRGGELAAHHIKPWAFFPELRYEIDNGLTLCEEHHKITYKEVWNYANV